MTEILPFVAPALAGSIARAEEGRGHREAHAPDANVAYQAINVGLFVVLIAILSRKKARAFFAGRAASFQQALVKADVARTNAESKKREIQDLLSQLESSSAQTADAARADAEQIKRNLLKEAEALRATLRQEAERTVHAELERAKAELRAEMIAQAMALAKTTLSEKILEPDQKRLQSEFVEKIQVVRP